MAVAGCAGGGPATVGYGNAVVPPATAKDSSMHGELINKNGRLRIEARGLCILVAETVARGHEIGSVYHHVPLCPPVPITPFPLICVHALCHLLGVWINRRNIAVALAVDGGVCTTADSIHLPFSVIVVDHVYISSPAPWHPLHTPFPKVIKHDANLHAGVRHVSVFVSEEHDLIMVGEIAV
nr:hypothetical protein Iba_chr03bCG16030 [Ipomoea batatas]